MSDDDDDARAPTLVIELADGLRRVALPRAAGTTIGRDARSAVVIDHPTVSRRHAEITYKRGKWRFRDSGSRNGIRAERRGGHAGEVALGNGTALRIGRVRAWFFADGVPATWRPDDNEMAGGKLIRCRCGHTGWAPAFVAGMAVPCRACGKTIIVGDGSTPTTIPRVRSRECAGCRSTIERGEPEHVCPDCGAAMHDSCYRELGGCATYGCPRVNELRVDDPIEASMPIVVDDPSRHLWTTATLGLIGLPLFGVPALAWAALVARRSRGAAIAAAAAGVAGVLVSLFGWSRLFADSGGGRPW